jgi:tRNA pseudouridine38-40 synthase
VEIQSAQMCQRDDMVLIRVTASHFLWRMVRRIIGVLVKLGTGQFLLDEFARTLVGEGREMAEWTAPAAGLFLERVLYPGDRPMVELAPVIKL